MPVFISHSHDDEAAYSSLCLALDGQNIPRRDVSKMSPGLPLSEQLRNAIDECEACIFIATKRSLDSRWCLAELGAFWGAGKLVVLYVADPEVTEIDHPPQFQGNLWTTDARRVIETIRTVVSAPIPEIHDNSDDRFSVARERILEYLNRKEFEMISFSGIRKYIDDEYTDDFLRKVVRHFYKDFRKAKIKGGKEGLSKF